MRLFLLATLSGLLIACGAADADDPASGEGGSPPCVGADCGCPDQAPSHGAPCDAELSCDYAYQPLGNGCDRTLEASCTEGEWDALRPASCEPATACDPSGAFTIVYGEWSNPAFVDAPPSTLTLAVDGEGAVVASAPRAIVTEGGCSLQAEWRVDDCTTIDGEEFCTFETYEATVDFSLDPPSGEMAFSCVGECGAEATSPITLEPAG